MFILGLRGSADSSIAQFSHDWVSLGEAGSALRMLREHGCRDVLFAGRVARPRFSEVKVDAKAVLLLQCSRAWAVLATTRCCARSWIFSMQKDFVPWESPRRRPDC